VNQLLPSLSLTAPRSITNSRALIYYGLFVELSNSSVKEFVHSMAYSMAYTGMGGEL